MKSYCLNCNSELKQSILTTVVATEKFVTDFINEFSDAKSPGYCTKCFRPLLDEAVETYNLRKAKATETIKNLIDQIPIVTIQSPLNWDYEVIGMITSQSVTGTGLVAEIVSDWTDFFGKQSNTYNKKLREGEDRCKAQLRMEALNLGANAIIAADIDYSEAGGTKGMLMVCISGTAVRLKNLEVLGKEPSWFIELRDAFNTTNSLSKHDLLKVTSWYTR